MKYKACCDTRCSLVNCEEREGGGCVHVCKLANNISFIQSEIDRRSLPFPGGGRYFPSDESYARAYNNLNDNDKNWVDKYLSDAPGKLIELQEKLKEYEIDG